MIERGLIGNAAEIPPGEPLTIVVGDDHGGVIGSVKVTCACGGSGWLSPSTQALIKDRSKDKVSIICIYCFRKFPTSGKA
jgi:hypothetical protein